MVTSFFGGAFFNGEFFNVGGGGGGSTVVFFNGVSMAPTFTGVSKKTITLSDAGGGTYNVTKTSTVSDEKSDSVMKETYTVDGDPV